MDDLVYFLPRVPILTERMLRDSLRQQWNTFQKAWNGCQERERQHLNERLGVADLAPLVEKITNFLKEEKKEHESKVNLDAMEEFVMLPNNGSEWLASNEIERAWQKARDIMRKYWGAVLYRRYQAARAKDPDFSLQAVWARRLQALKDWTKTSKSELPTAHALRHMQGLLAEL